MTYGWAILIIALVLGVLYSLGIMNPKNFIPRSPPALAFFRPYGPDTTDFISLEGTCGYLPMYVASFNGVDAYVRMSPPLYITTGVTKTAWVYLKPYDKGVFETIVDLGSPPNSIYLETYTHKRFMFGAYVGSGGNAFNGQTNEIYFSHLYLDGIS